MKTVKLTSNRPGPVFGAATDAALQMSSLQYGRLAPHGEKWPDEPPRARRDEFDLGLWPE